MESRFKLFGHPVHQMLIAFPLGLLGTAAIFDILRLATGNPTLGTVSWYLLAAGVLGGLLAAPAGLVDWMAIPAGTRAKAVGALHGLGNVVVLVLFGASWFLRRDVPESPTTLATILALGGLGLAVVTGWLGGELVTRLGVGVDAGADVNAASSLSSRARRSVA